MNKQTVPLMALFAGWVLTANATTYEDIAGQWCGDVTDYVFTPATANHGNSRPVVSSCATHSRMRAGEPNWARHHSALQGAPCPPPGHGSGSGSGHGKIGRAHV